MVNKINDLGSMIRWPFETLGTILNFIFRYFLEILIIIGSISFVYWLFKKGIIKNISDYFNNKRNNKEVKKNE